jgi:hypothetical protein
MKRVYGKATGRTSEKSCLDICVSKFSEVFCKDGCSVVLFHYINLQPLNISLTFLASLN